MPPIWPFKKKQAVAELDEAPPAPVVYKRGEDPNARKHIETNTGAYKDALALFGGGSEEVKAASDQSAKYEGVSAQANEPKALVSEPVLTSNDNNSKTQSEPSFEWIHHTDGYHYKQLANGAFEPTPHIKNDDGTYSPYS